MYPDGEIADRPPWSKLGASSCPKLDSASRRGSIRMRGALTRSYRPLLFPPRQLLQQPNLAGTGSLVLAVGTYIPGLCFASGVNVHESGSKWDSGWRLSLRSMNSLRTTSPDQPSSCPVSPHLQCIYPRQRPRHCIFEGGGGNATADSNANDHRCHSVSTHG